MTSLQPVSRFAWERIVRRVVMPGPTKLVGFVMAQYGDQRGEQIRPGTDRLASACGMGERTCERHLAALRDMGLIERVSNGGGPRRLAARYRLTIPEDLLERVELLDVDEKNSRHLDGGSSARTPAVQVAGDETGSGEGSSATQVAGVPGAVDNSPDPVDATVDDDVTPATQKAEDPTPTNPRTPATGDTTPATGDKNSRHPDGGLPPKDHPRDHPEPHLLEVSHDPSTCLNGPTPKWLDHNRTNTACPGCRRTPRTPPMHPARRDLDHPEGPR